MKNSRFLLNMLAFVFAIGCAVASAKSPLQVGYKFVAPGQPCTPSIDCNGTGPACMSGSDPVYRDAVISSGTECGPQLLHQP